MATPGSGREDVRELLTRAYAAFNARDIARALALMHPAVEWPNGMEGGYVHGHDAVRDYWTRQWRQIDPHVAPLRFTTDEAGRTVVDVHQVVRDLSGQVVAERMVRHVYAIERADPSHGHPDVIAPGRPSAFPQRPSLTGGHAPA